jgi:hypothetical protein
MAMCVSMKLRMWADAATQKIAVSTPQALQNALQSDLLLGIYDRMLYFISLSRMLTRRAHAV